ncbi:MAG: hypothetical protein CME65_04665 [Halobacteriovoraceae bacterium]|nr:hypothetical protein [Halobacteriovoraceae bacterium]
MSKDKKEQLFKDFLATGDILIVDKSSASRRRLTKTIVDMGGKRNQVHSVAHFSEAIEIIDSKKPKLILSDYEVNGGSGFDLFKHYREKYPEEKKSVLILVTSNISQSAVAKAAEEDVDSFIIKPYTVSSLEKSLIGTVVSKLHPSEYVKTIEKGKEALFEGNYEAALQFFDEAKKLNKKPSLALFYHGQTEYMMDSMNEAETDYKEGLEINNIHFKCQVGLYELFKKDEKYDEAYSVVRNIAKYFPANPDRLKEVVHLAVRTKNFEDMELYYELFTQLEERTEDVINYICSGMYVTGKYYMKEGQAEKARELFSKVGISCAGKSKFLKAMITSLVQNQFFDDSLALLKRMNSDDEEAYEISSFLANSDSMDLAQKISNGLDIWNKGFKDPYAMKVLIQALKEDGSDKKAQEYLEEAHHIWPDEFSAPESTSSTEEQAA